jgi:hypothetical protein
MLCHLSLAEGVLIKNPREDCEERNLRCCHGEIIFQGMVNLFLSKKAF